MPHSYGYRARTRGLFAKDFKRKGQLPLGRYLTTFKLGDYVDIKGDGGVHKGMPHKFYHGKTGIVWNVTPRAIGVVVNKQVRNRIIAKKIHVRIEHLRKSKCREDFLTRARENSKAILEAKKSKTKLQLKRTPTLPRDSFFVKNKTVATLRPVAFSGFKAL
eukprot:GILI01012211.1.p2 GENE.GILI01012211.1~~GILI01012211.1.p2  ORF type:complete len:161 (-),score=43.63 GILI01012211.1:54-536(-)